MPTFAEPARSPIPPPTARAAPTSARSKPVSAPRANSTITQMTPTITSNQFTQWPTERPLPLHVPRTIAFVRLVFNVSNCEDEAGCLRNAGALGEVKAGLRKSYRLRFFEARRGFLFD